MAIGGPFRELGRFLDDCEQGDSAVTRVDITESPATDRNLDLTANVDVALPAPESDESGPDIALTSPRVGPDGTLRFALESVDAIVPSEVHDVTVDPTGGAVDRNGSITISLEVTVSGRDVAETGSLQRTAECNSATAASSERRSSVDRSAEDPREESEHRSDSPEGESGREVPPFKDPDLLRSIFESHDTFEEMAETIEMDVTAETVRRYMIDYDIHQPDSYETRDSEDRVEDDARNGHSGVDSSSGAGDGDHRPTDPADGPLAETEDTRREPVVLSDGTGLPDDVTVETLIDTVKRSTTLYEVTRNLDIERQEALEMLEELNLLDLVVGRLSTEGERVIGREEVVERLRQASASA